MHRNINIELKIEIVFFAQSCISGNKARNIISMLLNTWQKNSFIVLSKKG